MTLTLKNTLQNVNILTRTIYHLRINISMKKPTHLLPVRSLRSHTHRTLNSDRTHRQTTTKKNEWKVSFYFYQIIFEILLHSEGLTKLSSFHPLYISFSSPHLRRHGFKYSRVTFTYIHSHHPLFLFLFYFIFCSSSWYRYKVSLSRLLNHPDKNDNRKMATFVFFYFVYFWWDKVWKRLSDRVRESF